jgi:tRNA modification GTPase
MFSAHELIVAPATVPGPGTRAIVRLAGDGLDTLLAQLFTAVAPGFAATGEPGRVVAARLADDGLGHAWGAVPVTVLHWPGPDGPIGGPLAEVQLPCSPPLVEAVVAEACRHGARLARGGEFTLRAFLAGRLDLLQAEAVLGVIDSRSPEELAAALDRMAGGAGAALCKSRAALLDLLADIEAAIDFADETTPDAVPGADVAAWRALGSRLETQQTVLTEVESHLARRGAGSGDLPRVVLVGRPNVGKSSLFNALVGRDAALVADEAGTTRDWIEARITAGAGSAYMLVDLAGVPEEATTDPLDGAAVAVARQQVARADVVVVCRDAVHPHPGPLPEVKGDAPTTALARMPPVAVACVLPEVPRIDVTTRCDRGGTAAAGVRTSVRDGTGIGALRSAIEAAVAAVPPRESPATLRMAVGVAAARAALAAVLPDVQAAAHGRPADEALVAAHVRRAVDALGEVTGAEIGTDLLDRIFSRHCIGK